VTKTPGIDTANYIKAMFLESDLASNLGNLVLRMKNSDVIVMTLGSNQKPSFIYNRVPFSGLQKDVMT